MMWHQGRQRRVWIEHHGHPVAVGLIVRRVPQAAEAAEIALHVATGATVVPELVTWIEAGRSARFYQHATQGLPVPAFFLWAPGFNSELEEELEVVVSSERTLSG